MTRFNEEIRNDFHTIKNIVLTVTLLLGDIRFFKSGNEKENIIINEYKFLWRTYSSLYINLILDLNKLFDDNESYSFNKLFNKISNNFSRIEWVKKTEPTFIDDMKFELIKIKKSDIINKIKTARDKYYAHLDNKRPPNIYINLDDLENLLKISQGFINRIYGPLEALSQSFYFEQSDIGHEMISDLYKYNGIRHHIYKEMEEDEEYSIRKIIAIMQSQ
jgi:hypothetical protein